MKVLLDTNFILTCVKENIHFDSLADEIFDKPIKWVVPQDVLNELRNIKDRHGHNSKDSQAARVSFEVLQVLKPEIVELPGKGPNIDIKIVNYILGSDIILATLDKDLKSRVKNKILTIRGKKSLELI